MIAKLNKLLSRGFFIAGAVFLMTETPAAQAQEVLAVSSIKGPSPHRVTITGPSRVLAKIANCRRSAKGWFGPGGNGLSVDWGDGTSGQELLGGTGSCADVQGTHVYSAPGTYKVTVEDWHPGPTDRPMTDWRGQITIRVTSGK